MHIENIISQLAWAISLAKPDTSIVNSMSDQVQAGRGFTEKQRTLALSLVYKYRVKLSELLKLDIQQLLLAPTFKYPVRTIQYAKSISVVEKLSTKVFAAQFPYNAELVDSIKLYKNSNPKFISGDIAWNGESRVWEFGYNEPNILFLAGLLDQGFTCDDAFAELAEMALIIEHDIEKHIPMLVVEGGKFLYKNTINSIPQPTSTNLVEVLLAARQYGITCWDDNIENIIESTGINNVIKTLLSSTTCCPVVVENSTMHDIKDAILYSKTVLFVIPGGTEQLHLSNAHTFLNRLCYTNEQISVMFRLDSSSGKMCNEYIKTHKLNNSISDDTKFVFVSGKIPKPLIEANKRFDLVVHFGTNSAHYTLKNFIKNHHNVISINMLESEPELKFV